MVVKIYRYPSDVSKIIEYEKDLDNIGSYSSMESDEYMNLPVVPKDIERILDDLYYREEDDDKGTLPLVVNYIDKPEDLFEAQVSPGGYWNGEFLTTKGNYYIAEPEYGLEITVVPKSLKRDAHFILSVTDPYNDKISKAKINKLKEFIESNNIDIESLPEDVIKTCYPKYYQDTKLDKALKKIEEYNGQGDLGLRDTPITSLPENLKVGGDLDLSKTQITSLPENLEVKGELDLRGTPITSLPKGLKVGGDLNLQGADIVSLPEGLEVGGRLYLYGTDVTSLPKGLKVGGSLNLWGIDITSLPENLKVGGDLDLSDIPITSLPKGLEVGGSLNLEGTKITSLPEDLEVRGDIRLPDGTQVDTIEEAKKLLRQQNSSKDTTRLSKVLNVLLNNTVEDENTY